MTQQSEKDLLEWCRTQMKINRLHTVLDLILLALVTLLFCYVYHP